MLIILSTDVSCSQSMLYLKIFGSHPSLSASFYHRLHVLKRRYCSDESSRVLFLKIGGIVWKIKDMINCFPPPPSPSPRHMALIAYPGKGQQRNRDVAPLIDPRSLVSWQPSRLIPALVAGRHARLDQSHPAAGRSPPPPRHDWVKTTGRISETFISSHRWLTKDRQNLQLQDDPNRVTALIIRHSIIIDGNDFLST